MQVFFALLDQSNFLLKLLGGGYGEAPPPACEARAKGVFAGKRRAERLKGAMPWGAG
jgi:hypothetical protein